MGPTYAYFPYFPSAFGVYKASPLFPATSLSQWQSQELVSELRDRSEAEVKDVVGGQVQTQNPRPGYGPRRHCPKPQEAGTPFLDP